MDERVDILSPPLFEPTGVVKTRQQAYQDGDWIGTFNLWIVSRTPEPAIIYQQRSPDRSWAPNLLDVTAGGHLLAGERLTDGLREVDEELGRHFDTDQVTFLGRKLYVGFNADGTAKNNVIAIYMVEDDAPLSTYVLQQEEVYALCACPVAELLRAHENADYTFTVTGVAADNKKIDITVGKESFPENYDDYHYKMAVLVDRYFRGDKNLLF